MVIHGQHLGFIALTEGGHLVKRFSHAFLMLKQLNHKTQFASHVMSPFMQVDEFSYHCFGVKMKLEGS